MVQFNIRGVPETVEDVSNTAEYIRVASTSDISSIVVFDSSARTPVEIKTEVLPQNLQNELSACGDDCKFVSYNFERQFNTQARTTSNLNQLLDLGPIVQIDTGVFLKETEKLPIVLSSLPTYDISYTSYQGTPIETVSYLKGPESCAVRCDALGTRCEGFNFNQMTFVCTLFSPGTPRDYDASLQSFKKADIQKAPRTLPYTSPTFNENGAGDKCRNPAACNSSVSNVITNSTLSSFTTGSFKDCKYCPVRKFYKLPTGEEAILTNEYGNAVKVTSFADAISMLKFNEMPVSQNDCLPGSKRLSIGGECRACDNTLPDKSAYKRLCEYVTCPDNSFMNIQTRWSTPGVIPYNIISCSTIPYGHYQLTTTSIRACGQPANSETPGPPPPIGFKWDPGVCTYSSCNGIVNNAPYDYLTLPGTTDYTRPIKANEIYIADPPRFVPLYPLSNYSAYLNDPNLYLFKGCNVTSCGPNKIANDDHTACIDCNTVGPRERRPSRLSCDTCSVPYGSGWKWMETAVAEGPTRCETVPCPSTPVTTADGLDQVWDSNNTNDMCAIKTCPIDQRANSTRTECVNRPGLSNMCASGNPCQCQGGSVKGVDSCSPCPQLTGLLKAKGMQFITSNSCAITYCPQPSDWVASNVFDIECTQRKCFASTSPAAPYTSECYACTQEPYTDFVAGKRYGYLSNYAGGSILGDGDKVIDAAGTMRVLTGCTLGECPLPTFAPTGGLVRWRYDVGCDHIKCPRIPAGGERWAGSFGCEIVSYTGSTSCSTYPRAGNKWADTTSCNIVACPSSVVLGPFELWGPGCTKLPLLFYQDRRNSSNTYPLKCATFPFLGQKYDGITPCNVVDCPLTPADGYIWTNDDTREYGCRTSLCTGYTFPNANKTKCIPCPPALNGWYSSGVGCRVEGCSNRQTLASNQYWSGPDCAYTTCAAGNMVVNQNSCTPCSTTLTSQEIWKSPGVTCDKATCTGQTRPNSSSTACEACPAITLAYGYTYDGVNGCTPAQCPSIGSSNIWASAGSCDNSKCNGHTTPNSDKSACVACPTSPSYGQVWASTEGCGINACTAISSSNIWASTGTCSNTVCTGHTTPNNDKSACVACPTSPSYGQVWASTEGCTINACPVISSSNIWTSIGSCSNTSCWTTPYMRPNATKTACETCPNPSAGYTYSSQFSLCDSQVACSVYSNYVDNNGNSYPYDKVVVGPYCAWTACSTGKKANSAHTACVNCPSPSPGYEVDTTAPITSVCPTKACTQTPAPGYFWDPNGGCNLFSCTTVFGLTLGYNQFWSGTGCIISTCPEGTVLTNGTCVAICDSSQVTLDSNSIYVPREGAPVALPTCPAYSDSNTDPYSYIPGWAFSPDCSIDLIPGKTYKFSTCLTSTQEYTGSCDPYNLASGQTSNCSVYIANGSKVLLGPLVANGQVVSGDMTFKLYDSQNKLYVSDTSGLIDIPINMSDTYTLQQTCTNGPCVGRSGYSGAATTNNFQYKTAGFSTLSNGQYDFYGSEECPSNPSFYYGGQNLIATIPLDSVGTYVFKNYQNDVDGIQGQVIITSPETYCMTQACVGHTRPDISKTKCQACTTTPGTTWAATNDCTTKACPTAPSLGNTWLSTDTSGACATMPCSTALVTGQYWAAAGFCATGMCAKGETVNAAKTGCTACTGIAASNIWTTVGTCANTACTGHTQPDTTKLSCTTCTCPPGNVWSSTSGCATQACTVTVPYGNAWDPTDTNGLCKQVTCPYKDVIIPGYYFDGKTCTRASCGTLTTGNGWDPTYDTFATCRQAPLTFVSRSTFSVTGFSTQFPLIKFATSTLGDLAISTSSAQSGGGSIFSTGTTSPTIQTGYTHIKIRPRGTTGNIWYFVITQPYTLNDQYIYGYLVDPVTNLKKTPWFTTTSWTLESPIEFGTMCPSPFTAGAGGQYLARSNTCSTFATCPTTAGYGQYYISTGIACDIGTCTTIAANQYFTSAASCSTSNCANVAQGFQYNAISRSLSSCPSIISCPIALSGSNGWVTDLTGTKCIQKVLVWSSTTRTSSATLYMNASPEYATTTGADYVRVANPYGTTFIAHPNGLTISDWTASGASKFPTTYTHIRFGVKGGSNPRITLQVTKPFALTDTKIYGFFVDDKNNYSTGFPPWTWGVALSPIAYYQFADTTVEFGNYS